MKKRWVALALAGLGLLAAGGCAQVGYYVQAAHGQASLLASARPIDDWLADPGASETLKARLRKVRQIRAFAASDLGLPDNGTFKTYADLGRPYVLWNVVATPEFSLEPVKWCFPVAGCVAYRGYYSKDGAQGFARELREQGLDVQVDGVPAYSTLGWFDDPVLSSFIQYPEPELARLVFHELAHQVAYAGGDSQFNESFATMVEEIGVERWLAAHGSDGLRRAYADYRTRKEAFLALLLRSRRALEENYARDVGPVEKKRGKEAVFARLQDEYRALKASWGGYAGYDRWFAEPLSNAHLASISTYHDFVPAFRILLQKERTLPAFYAAVQALAKLDQESRHARLAALGSAPAQVTAQLSPISLTAPNAQK